MSVYGFSILIDEDIQTIRKTLHYDDDLLDKDVIDLVLDSESLVLDYITDSFISGEYPRSIRRAVILLCGALDADAIGSIQELKNGNYLPERVQSMLYKYRTPTAI